MHWWWIRKRSFFFSRFHNRTWNIELLLLAYLLLRMIIRLSLIYLAWYSIAWYISLYLISTIALSYHSLLFSRHVLINRLNITNPLILFLKSFEIRILILTFWVLKKGLLLLLIKYWIINTLRLLFVIIILLILLKGI